MRGRLVPGLRHCGGRKGGDGKPDLIVANEYSNNIGILLGNGDGTFQAQKTFSTGSNSYPRSVAVADLNGDGKLDLVAAVNSAKRAPG